MENLMRKKLLEGRQVIGTFFESGSASLVEGLALAGMDYLIVDTEHGPFDVESTMDFVRAALLRGITPLARIKDCTRPSVLKMLDIGVQGLIIPCVNTVEEVEKLVEYGKYYPLGRRVFAFGRDAGWGYAGYAADIPSYFETCNRETMIIPQCETKGCLDHIEEVAATEGVDGIFIGPYDLSVALGRPAVFDTAEFKDAVAHILAACKEAGKPCLIYADGAATARARLAQGFDSAAVAMDTMIYIEAFRNLLKDIREG